MSLLPQVPMDRSAMKPGGSATEIPTPATSAQSSWCFERSERDHGRCHAGDGGTRYHFRNRGWVCSM